ncbi:MAG: ABC transporter ATP-binding protein [Acidobacteriota bacterium]
MESNKMTPILSLDNVTKTFEAGSRIAAVCGISLEIHPGERVAIMGPSGSGKSTLLNLICGLDEPTSGSVYFDGKDLSKLDDDKRTRLRREKIGMIFQTFNLLPTLNGVENVALPLRLNGVASKIASEKATAMLKRVGLDDRVHHRPDEMSGGERQRVAIARALIFDPLLLLADEPTGNLDSHTGDDVLNLLDDLHAEFNTTIVLVTHSDHAAEHCDRHVALLDGEKVSDRPFSPALVKTS